MGRPPPGTAGVSPASGPHNKAPWLQPKSSEIAFLDGFYEKIPFKTEG
ncbi:MAG: hypothetical protein [Olavius algarvensis Gamma 1 endosymbiont]|nr:MAG: hypothetical protein [Olavius algarvensis Gamma 1 endosymbiont]